MIERRSAVADLIDLPARPLVVAGLGSPVYDVYAAGDHPLHFYNWGAMGSAAMVGLGLALSQPDRSVIVFTGDGEMLMGLGGLCTIAQHRPPNLAVVVLDNEQYAETGMQATATGFGTDLAAVATACGLRDASTLRSREELPALKRAIARRDGFVFAVLKIEQGDQPRTVPLRDGAATAYRFRTELLGRAVSEGL